MVTAEVWLEAGSLGKVGQGTTGYGDPGWWRGEVSVECPQHASRSGNGPGMDLVEADSESTHEDEGAEVRSECQKHMGQKVVR